MLKHVGQLNSAPPKLLEHFGALVQSVVPDRASGNVAMAHAEGAMRLLTVALKHLSADCDYESWLRIGAVVFHVSQGSQEGFECFDSWSATSTKYKTAEVRSKWKSFRLDHPHPCTLGTLRFMLTQQGHDWQDVCMEAAGNPFEAVEMEVQE